MTSGKIYLGIHRSANRAYSKKKNTLSTSNTDGKLRNAPMIFVDTDRIILFLSMSIRLVMQLAKQL